MHVGKIRRWMFIYSVAFFIISILSVQNDIENKYYPIYVIYFLFNYLLMNLGNIIYAFEMTNKNNQ
jgi:uncharacterized membrane protein YadS